jgi:hypothetical protein
MNRIHTAVALVVFAACTAAPAHAQRVADLAPGHTVQAAPAQPALAPAAGTLSASRDLAPALRPAPAEAPRDVEVRRLSVAGHAAVGAGVGVAAGALASLAMFAFQPGCDMGDSMCGLNVPILIGGGALTGAAVGAVVGLVRNR